MEEKTASLTSVALASTTVASASAEVDGQAGGAASLPRPPAAGQEGVGAADQAVQEEEGEAGQAGLSDGDQAATSSSSSSWEESSSSSDSESDAPLGAAELELVKRLTALGLFPAEPKPPPLLSSFDLAGVAALIASGKASKIVCMVGAGISVRWVLAAAAPGPQGPSCRPCTVGHLLLLTSHPTLSATRRPTKQLR